MMIHSCNFFLILILFLMKSWPNSFFHLFNLYLQETYIFIKKCKISLSDPASLLNQIRFLIFQVYPILISISKNDWRLSFWWWWRSPSRGGREQVSMVAHHNESKKVVALHLARKVQNSSTASGILLDSIGR